MINNLKKYKTCLTIAGSDSSGGAGIQADLKTFSALGCYGMSVITALTAQNTCVVSSIHTPPAKFVGEQLQTTLDDIRPDAVKIGMLATKEIVLEVARIIREYKLINVVVDPVMISKSGKSLLNEDAITALITELFPLATIVTPNIPETEAILNDKILSEKNNFESAARKILEFGSTSVLIKGGHSDSNLCKDFFMYLDSNGKCEQAWLNYPRIDTKNTHGTGCTLSSAISAYLAFGESIKTAVHNARIYLQSALENGAYYKIGEGQGPANFFWSSWNNRISN